MIKTITKDGNHNSVSFKAEVKAYTQPKIQSSFTDPDGNVQYLLVNGNTILSEMYEKMWQPKKGKIQPTHYKGEGKDTRSNWMH